MSAGSAAAHALEEWLAARPELRLAPVFLPPDAPGIAWIAIESELLEAALHARERAPAEAKLRWWMDEARATAQGMPRHPLTQALGDEGREALVVGHAAIAAEAMLDEAAVPDVEALLIRVRRVTDPLLVARLRARPQEDVALAVAAAASLQLSRDWPRFAHPVVGSVPLALLARHGLAREAAADPERARAVIAALTGELADRLVDAAALRPYDRVRVRGAALWARAARRARGGHASARWPAFRGLHALWRLGRELRASR